LFCQYCGIDWLKSRQRKYNIKAPYNRLDLGHWVQAHQVREGTFKLFYLMTHWFLESIIVVIIIIICSGDLPPVNIHYVTIDVLDVSSDTFRYKNLHFRDVPTQPPIQRTTGGSFPEGKRSVREPEHTPTSSVEIKKMWSCTSTPQCVFMVWCLVNHRDNLTFCL